MLVFELVTYWGQYIIHTNLDMHGYLCNIEVASDTNLDLDNPSARIGESFLRSSKHVLNMGRKCLS